VKGYSHEHSTFFKSECTLDGGYRANAKNADLATGHGRVLVLSPFGGRSLHRAAWGTHLATQLEEFWR
jgi:NTE family protein